MASLNNLFDFSPIVTVPLGESSQSISTPPPHSITCLFNSANNLLNICSLSGVVQIKIDSFIVDSF